MAPVSLAPMQDLFPTEVVTGMVSMYEGLLHSLCNDESAWTRIVHELRPAPTAALPVAPPSELDTRLLHELFVEHATGARHDALAVLGLDASGGSHTSLTYRALDHASEAVWSRLADAGVAATEEAPSTALGTAATAVAPGSTPGSAPDTAPGTITVVAVVTTKGWEQVAAVMGVLRAGCAYLPINVDQLPRQRIEQILQLSHASAVVSDASTLGACAWLRAVGLPLVDVNEAVGVNTAVGVNEAVGVNAMHANRREHPRPVRRARPRELAYLIYTSGSTGVPKGVCCHHQGAVNTCLDLNDRFDVGVSDRVLALSSISFDLSVYDVFGLLGAGASLVVPPHDLISPPDPEIWLEIVSSHQITIWNTVPAFMELLIAHAEHSGRMLPACLRLIFLSGDWIARTLPGRIRAVSECAALRIISMGGATEAAIWSNMHELHPEGTPGAVLSTDPNWTSIPYGRPLRNQTMLILDDNLHHCEPWVTGVIHIGGAGVALGYYEVPRTIPDDL